MSIALVLPSTEHKCTPIREGSLPSPRAPILSISPVVARVCITPLLTLSVLFLSNEPNIAYENRLFKYRNHNFEVYWDSLDRSRVKEIYVENDESPRELTGLARLILSEQNLREYINSYRLKRALKRYDDGGEPVLTAPSGYASHEIPYGEKFTAER